MRERAPKYAITAHQGDVSWGYQLAYNLPEARQIAAQYREDGATEVYILRAAQNTDGYWVPDGTYDPIWSWKRTSIWG